MLTSQQLKELFPEENRLKECGLPPPVHQRETLVNGVLEPWSGPVETVRSAICVRKADGALTQAELGSYPVGGIPEAKIALDAAVRCLRQWDAANGRP